MLEMVAFRKPQASSDAEYKFSSLANVRSPGVYQFHGVIRRRDNKCSENRGQRYAADKAINSRCFEIVMN